MPAVLGSYQTQRQPLTTHSLHCSLVQPQGLETREEVKTVQMGDWGLRELNLHLLWQDLGNENNTPGNSVLKRPSPHPLPALEPWESCLSLSGLFLHLQMNEIHRIMTDTPPRNC